ncbi:hypothetical protein FPV67DRAFT_1449467 [Lyophyllum atratum]|nr:hypothetical protein FPV67DRAFT_1449467 [Lyophyllum atratum]
MRSLPATAGTLGQVLSRAVAAGVWWSRRWRKEGVVLEVDLEIVLKSGLTMIDSPPYALYGNKNFFVGLGSCCRLESGVHSVHHQARLDLLVMGNKGKLLMGAVENGISKYLLIRPEHKLSHHHARKGNHELSFWVVQGFSIFAGPRIYHITSVEHNIHIHSRSPSGAEAARPTVVFDILHNAE